MGHTRAVLAALGIAAAACSRGRSLPAADGDASETTEDVGIDQGAAPFDGEPSVDRAFAPPDEPPPYDLSADLATRSAEARTRLGPTSTTDVVDDVFLFASSRRDAPYEGALKLARKALDAYFNRRFARRPDRAITVIVFSSEAAFHAFCKSRFDDPRAADLGVYDPARREVVVDAVPGLGTLTHELVHPIVQSDFPDAPEWLNEGLGALFEQPVFPHPGEIHGARNWRLARLRGALASPTERDGVRVESLFGMRDSVFLGKGRDLHYAMARYVCQWLDERGELWPFYGAWRDGVIDDATGEKAFARATGMTPQQASEDWRKWVTR